LVFYIYSFYHFNYHKLRPKIIYWQSSCVCAWQHNTDNEYLACCLCSNEVLNYIMKFCNLSNPHEHPYEHAENTSACQKCLHDSGHAPATYGPISNQGACIPCNLYAEDTPILKMMSTPVCMRELCLRFELLRIHL
jgi:hypothetical protein